MQICSHLEIQRDLTQNHLATRPDPTDTIDGVTAAMSALRCLAYPDRGTLRTVGEGQGLVPVGRLSGVEPKEAEESCLSLILKRG